MNEEQKKFWGILSTDKIDCYSCHWWKGHGVSEICGHPLYDNGTKDVWHRCRYTVSLYKVDEEQSWWEPK